MSSLGKHWKLSKEQKENISNGHKGQIPWIKGKHHTKKTKEKLSFILRGKPGRNKGKHWIHSEQSKINIANGHKGETNYLWKGDDVSYSGLHNWVKRNLGKPTKCEHCGKDGLAGKQIHWANIDHKYKRNLIDWIRLCLQCHQKYDMSKNNKYK